MRTSAFSKKKMKTSSTSPIKDKEPWNWADLQLELTSLILIRLSVPDKLNNAQKVCRGWRRVGKNPWMWRKIDMRGLTRDDRNLDCLASMCRHGVDLSGLLEIKIDHFVRDSLLSYYTSPIGFLSYLYPLHSQARFVWTLSHGNLQMLFREIWLLFDFIVCELDTKCPSIYILTDKKSLKCVCSFFSWGLARVL